MGASKSGREGGIPRLPPRSLLPPEPSQMHCWGSCRFLRTIIRKKDNIITAGVRRDMSTLGVPTPQRDHSPFPSSVSPAVPSQLLCLIVQRSEPWPETSTCACMCVCVCVRACVRTYMCVWIHLRPKPIACLPLVSAHAFQSFDSKEPAFAYKKTGFCPNPISRSTDQIYA